MVLATKINWILAQRENTDLLTMPEVPRSTKSIESSHARNGFNVLPNTRTIRDLSQERFADR